MLALVLVVTSPAVAQDACTWDFADVFSAAPVGHADFRAVYRALGERVTEYTSVAVEVPRRERAARAAMCADGGCTGDGPWLVIVSQESGSATVFSFAIVTRHERALYVAYQRTQVEGLCAPLTGTLEHDGTSFVARIATVLRDEGCARYTSEVHLLIDVEGRRIGSTAARWITPGERSTLSLRQADDGWTITGCGTERRGPSVGWMGFDGSWR